MTSLCFGLLCLPAQAQSAQQQPQGSTPAPAPASAVAQDAASADELFLTGLDATNGLKMWNIPSYRTADSILGDAGGFRKALAQYGISILVTSQDQFADNLFDRPRNTKGQTNYWGQKASYISGDSVDLTVDLGHYGDPGGQLAISGELATDNDKNYAPDAQQIGPTYFYQSLFDNHVEFQIGYLANGFSYVGSYVGGNLANTFGVSSAVPYEVGLSFSPGPAPGINVKFNLPGHFYDIGGIQRSINPQGLLFDVHENATGLRFSEPHTGVLLIDEIGYKRAAAPGKPDTWLRAGYIHNNSGYENYATGGHSRAQAGYVLFDRQLWQSSPASPLTAYQGIYVGGTYEITSARTAPIYRYLEARAYGVGIIPGRPLDMISFVYSHQDFSKYLRGLTDEAAPVTGLMAFSGSNSYTVSYIAHVAKGVDVGLGAGYTDHPAITYVPKQGDDLNFLGSVLLVF